MYKNLIAITVLASAVSLTSAQTNTHTDTNITAIYGSGNSDTNWTAGRDNDIEVGLRAKYRNVGPITPGGPGNNVYIVQPGISSGSAALWNFDFSILSDTTGANAVSLLTYDYKLSLDTDPSAGISFDDINFIEFNPVAPASFIGGGYFDNQYGYSDTLNGDKEFVATLGTLQAQTFAQDNGLDPFTKAQNSRNYGWDVPGFDPFQPGTYNIKLEAFDKDNHDLLAGAEIQVVVVPEPAAVLGSLLGLGMIGFVGYRRRKAAKA